MKINVAPNITPERQGAGRAVPHRQTCIRVRLDEGMMKGYIATPAVPITPAKVGATRR